MIEHKVILKIKILLLDLSLTETVDLKEKNLNSWSCKWLAHPTYYVILGQVLFFVWPVLLLLVLYGDKIEQGS